MSEAAAELPLSVGRFERTRRNLHPARLWWAGNIAVGSVLLTVHDHGLIQKPLGTGETAEAIQGTFRHLGPTALAASFITRSMYERGFSRDAAVGVGGMVGIGLNVGNELLGYVLNKRGIDIQGWQSWIVSSNPPQVMDVLVPANAAVLAATFTPLEEELQDEALIPDAPED